MKESVTEAKRDGEAGRQMKRRTIAAAAALLGAMAMAPATGSAHTERWNTTTTKSAHSYCSYTFGCTEYSWGIVDGVVNSSGGRCVADRTIKVFVARYPDSWELFGTDLSDTTGAWRVEKHEDGGYTYRVTVTPKDVGRNNHRHICEGYASRPFDASISYTD